MYSFPVACTVIHLHLCTNVDFLQFGDLPPSLLLLLFPWPCSRQQLLLQAAIEGLLLPCIIIVILVCTKFVSFFSELWFSSLPLQSQTLVSLLPSIVNLQPPVSSILPLLRHLIFSQSPNYLSSVFSTASVHSRP